MSSEAGWETRRLGDVAADCRYGYTASASDRPLGPKLLRITDIVGDLDWDAVPFAEASVSETAKYLLQDGDIVIGRTGANVGASAHVRNPPTALFASYLVRFRFDRDEVCDRFVGYVLKSPLWADYVKGAQTGSGQPQLNATIMKGFEFPLPPLEEQRRIAWVLGALDEKIELNRRLANTLEEVAAALFQARFVDFAGEEDLEPSEIGPIPRGWRAAPFSEAVRVNPAVKTVKKGSVVPHVGMADVPAWGTRPDRVEAREYSGGARFEPKDTLMARITGCIEHGKGAFVDFLEQPAAGSTEFLVFRAVPPLTPEMVFLLSRTRRVRDHAIASMSGSSGRQRVQRTAFDHIAIAVPPNPEAVEAEANLLAAAFEQTRALWRESQTLVGIRNLLLPRLVSGRIRVDSQIEPSP
jgi:type I restriction enzyme S subunit